MPFFSIVLPTYNRASFLQRSISSVLSQTFTDFELIIIDDASTDNTKEIIDTFNDEKIRYFKNEKNRERSVYLFKRLIILSTTHTHSHSKPLV